MTNPHDGMSRRHVMQILAALGITGPLAACVAEQAQPGVSPATLKTAAALLGGTFDEPRLEVASKALDRNLAAFEVVRELEIDDAIEPPTIFVARR
ncbi:MAG: hypothetical protein AB7H88_02775 [Vicinamibacterales bacterium]